MTPFQRRVAEVVAALAPGEVVTYSEVACQAGHPGAARAVGSALQALDDCPWWRVVTARGRLAPGKEREQAERLRAEGVVASAGMARRRP